MRFNDAARELGVRVGFGAELSLDVPTAQGGVADPVWQHLLVIARGQEGYHRLCRVISRAQLAGGEKSRPVYDIDALVDDLAGHVVVLTGCRKGAVRHALVTEGPAAAHTKLQRLVDRFGREHVFAELIDHYQPLDSTHNDHLAAMAKDLGVATVVSNNVHYARPEDGDLADALAAVRARRSIEDLEGWLPADSTKFRCTFSFRTAPGLHLCNGSETGPIGCSRRLRLSRAEADDDAARGVGAAVAAARPQSHRPDRAGPLLGRSRADPVGEFRWCGRAY